MIDLFKKRRSIRKFKNKKIEKNKIEKLCQAALLAPTSRNIKPYEFIVIDDKSILLELSNCKTSGSDFLKEAPIAIIILGNESKSDAWVEDCSIATTYIMLEAQSLELSSCWIKIKDRMAKEDDTSEDFVRRILNIPNKYRVLSILAIGYANEDKAAYIIRDLEMEKIHYNLNSLKIYTIQVSYIS